MKVRSVASSTRARDRVHGIGEARPVAGVARIDGDVAHGVRLVNGDEVDSADHSPGVADRRGDLAQHPRNVVDLDPQGEAVLGARGGGHSGRHLMGWVGCGTCIVDTVHAPPRDRLR